MNFEMIRQAARRLHGHAQRTPILWSPFLDEIAGRRVYVKAEALQHTGSFKFRGAWSAISALSADQLKTGVIAYSSGNHAQGVARAARAHGSSAVIVMPSDAPLSKINNTKGLGAEVVLYDRAHDDRDAMGDAIAAERGLTLIKPFDDPQVIAGQGTIGLELRDQLPDHTGQVLVCCGGGGLSSGIALALEETPMQVRPVEPEGFDDVTRSLSAGRILRNPATTGSICDAILSPQPGDVTFPIMHRLCGPGVVVSDEQCLHAMALAFAHLKLVLEPGGAIALAAALFHGDQVEGDEVIAMASGGNVDAGTFALALDRFPVS